MKIKRLLLGCCIAFPIMLTACSTTVDPADAYKNESAQQIFDSGEKAMRGGNYREAIQRFEALDVQYPFGKNTEIAQLQIIYAYYMTSDYASAESAADRFIRSHPTSEHVDYAYFMRGLSNYYQNMGIFERMFAVDLATRDLTQIKKSFADFSELVKLFPDSPYAPAAHQYMIYLRNILADHELDVAKYYYERKAYIAAANRASLVVRYYQGTASIPDALVIMVKSYRHLNMTSNENEAMAVLQTNFPNSVYVNEAMSSS
jgi:outer membrane protein assembly factor BamD